MNAPSVSQTPRRLRFALVLGVLSAAMLVSSANAKPAAAQKCAAAKRRLVGKKIAALTTCDAMAVAKGVAVDPTCAAKATTRFVTAWGKVEKAAGGACITRDDATTIGAIVDAHDADLETALGITGAAS